MKDVLKVQEVLASGSMTDVLQAQLRIKANKLVAPPTLGPLTARAAAHDNDPARVRFKPIRWNDVNLWKWAQYASLRLDFKCCIKQ